MNKLFTYLRYLFDYLKHGDLESVVASVKYVVNITYYLHITFIVEEKHSGQFPIQDAFNDIALFEFGKVDELNIYAKKIKNY